MPVRRRPFEVTHRDRRVFEALADGPLTRRQLVQRLREEPYLIYLSLLRLREDGRVRRVDRTGMRQHWEQVKP